MPQAGAVNIGNEGCTPGYWKNHQDNWEEYKPTDTLGDHETDPAREFVIPDEFAAYRDVTFADALKLRGRIHDPGRLGRSCSVPRWPRT